MIPRGVNRQSLNCLHRPLKGQYHKNIHFHILHAVKDYRPVGCQGEIEYISKHNWRILYYSKQSCGFLL